MNNQDKIYFIINKLYKINNIYNNFKIYGNPESIEIYNLYSNKINLNNYENIDSNNKLINYKNNLLLLYQTLNINNNSDICYLKNICILYCLIIDKLTNVNYLDNRNITEYLNNLAKNNNNSIIKDLNNYYFENIINFNSIEILIYLCHNKLYNFNNNDMQNYYNFILKNKKKHDIHHKRFLGTLLYSGYDIKYNQNIYNKDKIIKFAKLINNYIFINFDNIKLLFNALFTHNKIYNYIDSNKFFGNSINFNNKFYLINIIFAIPENKLTNSTELINYYTEYMEDIHYFKYDKIPFLKLNIEDVISIIDKLIENNNLTLDKINIIYKSLFYLSYYKSTYKSIYKSHYFKIIDIITKLFDYIKLKLNLNEIFYKNIFNIANFDYINNYSDFECRKFDYYFIVLELVIPKIKSFNILYNIFYYENNLDDTHILFNLIDRKFFTQNIFELSLLVNNKKLINYYIKNNLVNINSHNFNLAIKFNNIELYDHLINNKYIINDNEIENIDEININNIYINNYKNNFFNRNNKKSEINLFDISNNYNVKYNLNINNLDLKNNKNLINKAYFYNNYDIIQNKNYNKHNKEILKLVKKLVHIDKDDIINKYINYFNNIVNYINNIKETENKYNYVLLAVNNLHNKNKLINNFLLILKLFYIKFKIKPTIYKNLPEYLFY